MAPNDRTRRFELAFDTPFSLPGRLLGVRPDTSGVEVDDEVLRARFGRWELVTPRRNIREATITGPYAVHKTIGPAHLSLRDRGLTFATNPRRGVCLRFTEPVPGLDPLGLVRHPGLTVTVADPEGLVALLVTTGTVRREAPAHHDRQVAIDRLRTLPASDLRELAEEHGVDHPASASHHELVDLLEDRIDDIEPALLELADASLR